LEEVYTYLVLARRLEYLDGKTVEVFLKDLEVLRKLINGYVAFLKRNKRGANEPGADLSIREAPLEYEPDINTRT